MQFTIFLALVAVFAGGFVLGLQCAVYTIEARFPVTWKVLCIEAQANKQKRADAARNKEA